MDWIIITSDAGKRIVPVQKWLLNKYVGWRKGDFIWIDLGDAPLNEWCKNVAKAIREINPTPVIVLMLDDQLILDYVTPDAIKQPPSWLDRLEFGNRNKWHKNAKDCGDHYEMRLDGNYTVSTQISSWKTRSLLKVLDKIKADPWTFEVKGKCKAGVVKSPAFKFLPETALSKRWQGVNIRMMKDEDRDELIELGLLNEQEIVYSGK